MDEGKSAVPKTDRLLLGILAISLFANISLCFLLQHYRILDTDQKEILNLPPITRGDMAELTANSPPAIGPTGAPVVIVEFSDFQCPFCKHFAASLQQVDPKEKGRYRLVFRQFPLISHPYARKEAELSACVSKQSNSAFWALHDYFFSLPSQREDHTDSAMEFLKARSDIKISDLHNCVDKHQSATQVDQDILLGKKYKIRATPTIFINGARIVGSESPTLLSKSIKDASWLSSNDSTLNTPAPHY